MDPLEIQIHVSRSPGIQNGSPGDACIIDKVADGVVLAPPAPPNSSPKGGKMDPIGQKGSDMS